jgi:hypothetical protein
MRTGKEAWQLLYSIVRNEELVLAMRASRNDACQWFIGWLDEVYYPWQARGRCGPLPPPADRVTRFLPLMTRAVAAAEREMDATAGALARLWPPSWPADLPDEPMLPGEWPQYERPARPKRGANRAQPALNRRRGDRR